MKKPTAKAVKKAKTTHRIEFWKMIPFGMGRSYWNWRVRAANGEILASSHQAYSRKIDARAAVRNFLDAVRAGTVEIKG